MPRDTYLKKKKSGAEPKQSTDVLIQKTMELLSSVLHANPHVSIRDSLRRGEDIPLQTNGILASLLSPCLAQIWEEAILLCVPCWRNDAFTASANTRHPSCRLQARTWWFIWFFSVYDSRCSTVLRHRCDSDEMSSIYLLWNTYDKKIKSHDDLRRPLFN